MKTKNVTVKMKDIKAGVTIFVAHPVYGIDEYIVTSKPYPVFHSQSIYPSNPPKVLGMFFNCRWIFSSCEDSDPIEDSRSCQDAGITAGESYNYRRTFFKRKHAEEWCRKMKTDPGFIAQHQKHLDNTKDLFDYMYDDDYDDDYMFDYHD